MLAQKRDFPLKIDKKSTSQSGNSFLTQHPKPRDSLIQNHNRPMKLRFNLFDKSY